MRVVLPSNGVLGTKVVEMRPVRFDDLRAIYEMNQQEDVMRATFVKRLLLDIDYNKITKMDFDYLYYIAAFSVVFNTVSFSVECPNDGTKIKSEFALDSLDVVSFPKVKLPLKETLDGVNYSYHILSAQQHFDALDYSLSQEDESTAYEKAVASFILGKTPADIPTFIDTLSVGVYVSAFLFQQACFHGVKLDTTVKCSKCGQLIPVTLTIPMSMIRVDLDFIMKSYSSVSDQVSFEAFLKFTIPEYKALITALNEKVKNG